MGSVIFNGISSRELHIQVEHPPEYEYPERDYTITHVPGRNGDVVFDNGSYKNVGRTYQIAIGEEDADYAVLANKISEWLHSANGYARLEDSYEPDYYRMAMYYEGLPIENILNQAGRATIKFDCKPQRFLKYGEQSIEIQNGANLHNPTRFAAKPLIRVYGTGGAQTMLTVGDRVVTLTSITDYVDLDCDLENAFKGSTNCNGNITAEYFPVLASGDNAIVWAGNITKVEITPRWWTL